MPLRVVTEDTSDPWYLTIIRTQGLLFVRPEKSWRPLVCLNVVDRPQLYEVGLGCDGQNPNTKIPLRLHQVDERSKLDIKVLHKSHKHRKKQHLIASAIVSLGELASKQVRPGSAIDVRLSCPTPQKKGPTIKSRQQHHACLVIKLRVPQATSPVFASKESHHSTSEDDALSEPSSSRAPSETVVDDQPDVPPSGVRRRKRRIRGYSLNTDDEDGESVSAATSSYPGSPREEYFPPIDDTEKPVFESTMNETPESMYSMRSPDVLPRYSEHAGQSMRLSWGERVLNRISPYAELYEAQQSPECTRDERFDKVLARLLTEWYVVAASLLALAGIDAAIFGLAPGSIFPIDGLARMVVALGAISAGLGLFLDTLLVFSYSNADAHKFQNIARDVYGTYFFFCLYCRVPTVCMLVSVACLAVFLLTVAWAEWPSAVLVVSFLAGVLFTLQYLVFGCHRMFNFTAWCVRRVWRALVSRPTGRETEGSAVVGDVGEGVVEGAHASHT
ncbi:hypothetical protein DAEQUDRAFT_733601 [Daedalea quercina L-15889]|uniref:Uncharacterized protein n=1 Tax=Daedalea quercina L-15889 TaxID=1314783 RepID=A0A165KVG2_9APHY|nr:hypothetical protein DAEQUDRAFT_733601 [Daedalea quercina L-15889]